LLAAANRGWQRARDGRRAAHHRPRGVIDRGHAFGRRPVDRDRRARARRGDRHHHEADDHPDEIGDRLDAKGARHALAEAAKGLLPQLIVEADDLLGRVGGLGAPQQAEIFARFGAHTHERTDKPELGVVHSEWLE
jgi:hypothetical protein